MLEIIKTNVTNFLNSDTVIWIAIYALIFACIDAIYGTYKKSIKEMETTHLPSHVWDSCLLKSVSWVFFFGFLCLCLYALFLK